MKKIKPQFYHSTIKRLISVFGSVFNDIYYVNDKGEKKKVTLLYSPRELFFSSMIDQPDKYQLKTDMPLPRLGFEMTSMNYAPERSTNPLHKISNGKDKWQYNRVAYDFTFMVYLLSKDYETSLKIVEQILPLFSPSFNVTINELDDFFFDTDVAIVLNSVQPDIEYQGLMDNQRKISWTLQFTVKSFLYNETHRSERIKEVISKFTASQMDEQYDRFTAVVEPRTANREDPHIIVETWENGND